MIEVLAPGTRIIFLSYGSGNLQQMTNDFLFSAICTEIHGTNHNSVLEWILKHRDPKRAAIAPLT